MTTETLGQHDLEDIVQRLRGPGLALYTPPVSCRIHSNIPALARALKLLYADYSLWRHDYADFHFSIRTSKGLRRWYKPQVLFDFDGHTPFYPLPLAQAHAVFEWGLNWCISNHDACHLVIHAAVIAREDRAIILPGEPGAGKSTLCAALINRGFRLLSDEITLIDDHGARITPIPRPVSLKNASIEVIRAFTGDAVLTDPAHDTTKGSVAHLKPPGDSVRLAQVPARPAALIFPRYVAGAPTRLNEIGKAEALMRLVSLSFNYQILGKTGFERATAIVEQSGCYEFEYSDLDQAIVCFHDLMYRLPT